jgi:monoterpene epsilon-lactone hydrolase
MVSAETARARELLSHLVSDPDAGMEGFRRLYGELLDNFVLPQDAEVADVDAGGVPAVWVSAPGTSRDNVVVALHGGGFCMGTARGYDEFAYRISLAADARVLVVDYRLAPEDPFPAALDDTVTAYRWVRQQGARRIALVGDSAGGGLVVSALVQLRDAGDELPCAGVAMSPLVDLAGESPSLTERAHLDPLPAIALVQGFGGAYLAGREPKETPLASPLYADLTGLPPLRILVGSDEGLHDDAVRLAEKARAAGNQVEFEVGEGMVHIWPVFGFLPEAQAAIDRVGEFLRKRFVAAA